MIVFHYLMYRLYERNKVSEYSDMPLFYSCIGFMCFFQLLVSLIFAFLVRKIFGIVLLNASIANNKILFLLCITLPIFIIDYLFYSKIVNIEQLSKRYKKRKFWLDKVNWFIIYMMYNIIGIIILVSLMIIFDS